jgi:Family of unknown function (DUF6356)
MSLHLFTAHPAAVGESYAEHLAAATGFGGRMIFGGFACLLHGLLPFVFRHKGSDTIAALHEAMVVKRRRRPATLSASIGVGRPAAAITPASLQS